MEVKKSPKADLEGKKSTWLLVGYVVVLAFMFVAFEWTQRDVKIDTSQAVADVVFEEEIIPITETPEQAATAWLVSIFTSRWVCCFLRISSPICIMGW